MKSRSTQNDPIKEIDLAKKGFDSRRTCHPIYPVAYWISLHRDTHCSIEDKFSLNC